MVVGIFTDCHIQRRKRIGSDPVPGRGETRLYRFVREWSAFPCFLLVEVLQRLGGCYQPLDFQRVGHGQREQPQQLRLGLGYYRVNCDRFFALVVGVQSVVVHENTSCFLSFAGGLCYNAVSPSAVVAVWLKPVCCGRCAGFFCACSVCWCVCLRSCLYRLPEGRLSASPRR